MAQSVFDTIVAPITGTGPAAVAWIRVSGRDAWTVASKVFSEWPESPTTRTAVYGRYTTGDDGLALPFAQDHGYTGDESVEFSLHGSPASLRALIDECVAAGARPAQPGEFTERAFLNGRIDLTQAEAVRDTVEAQTLAQLRLANLHRAGGLLVEVGDLRESLIGLLASVEASVDFSEEIGELDRSAAAAHLEEVLSRVRALRSTARSGRILREGLRIAIAGPPNAGKSSLLNALLGEDRAIVTPTPGTTRDSIEATVDLGGVPCVLIDTAGIRESADDIEGIGIERARIIAANADLVWWVQDATEGTGEAVLERPEVTWRLFNKIDLLPSPLPSGSATEFPISALSGEGLCDLIQAVQELADLKDVPILRISPRHDLSLQRTDDALVGVLATLGSSLPDDLISVGLGEAIHSLGEITGETASPDVLERIFHDFCIGK